MAPTKPPKLKKLSQPPKSKAWDAPPFPAKGDDDERNTFEWVGRALSEWERFEAFFGLSFGVFVGSFSYDGLAPAMRAYGAVASFRGRLDMIKAAADAHVAKHPQGDSAVFKHICEEAEGFSARRNEISHGVVQLYYPDGKPADRYWGRHAILQRNRKAATIDIGSQPRTSVHCPQYQANGHPNQRENAIPILFHPLRRMRIVNPSAGHVGTGPEPDSAAL